MKLEEIWQKKLEMAVDMAAQAENKLDLAQTEIEYFKNLAVSGYKLKTDLQFWHDMTGKEIRIRCGYMSSQEISAVKAVLSKILLTN